MTKSDAVDDASGACEPQAFPKMLFLTVGPQLSLVKEEFTRCRLRLDYSPDAVEARGPLLIQLVPSHMSPYGAILNLKQSNDSPSRSSKAASKKQWPSHQSPKLERGRK